jgi:hypothetical protein
MASRLAVRDVGPSLLSLTQLVDALGKELEAPRQLEQCR